jgi:hypothetical protein
MTSLARVMPIWTKIANKMRKMSMDLNYSNLFKKEARFKWMSQIRTLRRWIVTMTMRKRKKRERL